MTARKTAITVASAAAIAMVLPAVKKSEGYWPTVKVDTVGTGRPCTGGYGETEGVKCGETHNEKFWSDRLEQRIREYDARIGECITVNAPDSVRAAMITTSYNAGTGALCKSLMVARINAGDFAGACAALLTKDAGGHYNGWYIRAQGRVLPGLINRRRDDQKMCRAYQNPQKSAEIVKTRMDKFNAEEIEKDKTAAGMAAHQHMPAPVEPPKPAPKKPWWSWIFK